MNFSVLMLVYRNDKPEDFRTAVESISTRQTLRPNEIILVVDGPVPQMLEGTIRGLDEELPELKVLWQEKNQGQGKALAIGMEAVSYELVARMDADDISVPDRFEKQVAFMKSHPQIAVCGGQIAEFIGTPDNIVGYRNVPLSAEKCRAYLKSRTPVNQVAVMFRKKAVMEAGNYQHCHLNEDTFLWLRMALIGCEFANLPETLVNVRVGEEMYGRRGEWAYFKSNKWIQDYCLRTKFISPFRYLYNLSIQFIVQVLMPNIVRGWIYKNILRSKKST